MKDPLVSIIIVSWNGLELLKKCLKSLSKVDYQKLEIVLVDNGSEDGTQIFIKNKYPHIKLIENKTNLGFAKANNVGYKSSTGEAILFLNNDTIVDKNFLLPLINVLDSDKKIGAVQSKILLMSKTNIIDSVGSFLTNTGFLYHFGYYKKASSDIFNKQMEIYSAKGACMLFKREVLEEVGLFDDDYFAYFEETDLCHRVWLAGYKILYIPDSKIFHKGGETSNRLNSSFVQYHSYKNRLATFIKNLSIGELIKIIPLHVILCLVSATLFLVKGKFGIFIAINKALIWNLVNLDKLLNKRKYVQKNIRKIKDQEFMPKIKKTIGLQYLYYLFIGLESMPQKYYERTK